MVASATPPEEEQIVATSLNLVTIYLPGTAKDHMIYWANDEEGYSGLS